MSEGRKTPINCNRNCQVKCEHRKESAKCNLWLRAIYAENEVVFKQGERHLSLAMLYFLYSTFGLRESHTIRGLSLEVSKASFALTHIANPTKGRFEFDLMVPGNTTMNLVVYYDAPESWDRHQRKFRLLAEN